MSAPTTTPLSPQDFLARWQHADGSELANYQLFVADLCRLLDVPMPDPAREDTRDNAYVFERRVTFRHGDGSESAGRIDCYRRSHFVLEAKKIKAGATTKGFDDALQRARGQAEGYARALPAAEGRPPFLVVVDVGHVIELYADFTCSGATYTPFPDSRSHRIRLADLCAGNEAGSTVRQRLRTLWLDPHALDPARASAKVTREIADHLAGVAKSLEGAGHHPELVAGFLTRCLFSMFAEDVGLLPKENGKGAFSALLESLKDTPQQFVPLVGALWQEMDTGGFSVVLRQTLPRFNGKLFKRPDVIPLTRDQIDLLLEAARADWTQVEPAIFGTLLERALSPLERHALGAHYTPRAYVERLVLPTVIEPLRGEWQNVQAAALLLANEGKLAAAAAEVDAFHHRLCQVRVLDPACGSANFLYVTLEHMKRLEGEVLDQLHSFGAGQQRIEAEGLTVDPHQFLGLELNPRAAAIAELVLWIGYLQWHFRTQGSGLPPQPILKDFRNVECRDAVLAWDSVSYATDETGKPLTRWDGRTTKPHPVTGEPVPDETARIPLERYENPRPAVWPQADFIVGNPPFIGNKRMRDALGDGYVEALRGAWKDMPDTADFVMYWWEHAAKLVREHRVRAFGFITTNSLRQTFNRQIIDRHLNAKPALGLRYAIPDHPWVDSANGADVRIAMTVGAPAPVDGRLAVVSGETAAADGEIEVTLETRIGEVHADLTVGAKVGSAQKLAANQGVCFQGMNLVGKGFRLTPEEVQSLGYKLDALPEVIKPHRNARDMMQGGEDCFVIDLFGLTAEQARETHPALYQWLLDRVKPERDHNNRESRRRNWWIFGEPVGRLRRAWGGLNRVVLTPETSKHRVFSYQALPFCPDHKLYVVCSTDAYVLGVLSSNAHAIWALRAGGRLGVGNDPTWTNTTCFLTFPFPAASEAQQARIRDLAEQLDAHRKRQQAAHESLTLTGMYNVLEKLRSSEPLTAKEKTIHEQGLVGVLKTLHDEIDAAVLDAYGWGDLVAPLTDPARHEAADETLLERLVALNAERAAEEAKGHIRWLRPEFQAPESLHGTVRMRVNDPIAASTATSLAEPALAARLPWPPTLPEQVAAVARVLADAAAPLSEPELAARFTGKGPWKKRLPQIIDTLEALGRVRRQGKAILATS